VLQPNRQCRETYKSGNGYTGISGAGYTAVYIRKPEYRQAGKSGKRNISKPENKGLVIPATGKSGSGNAGRAGRSGIGNTGKPDSPGSGNTSKPENKGVVLLPSR
jgi:hypothetical protein